AIRATNCATRIFVAQVLCHPRIRTRFANWNRLQYRPGAQLKRRPDRSQRNVKPELLAREVILQLGTNTIEIPMVSGHDICSQSFAQNRQLAFCRAPIDEFKQAQPLVVSDSDHWPERRIDSLRKQWCMRPGICWRFTKDLSERVPETAFRFKATSISRLIHPIALPHLI